MSAIQFNLETMNKETIILEEIVNLETINEEIVNLKTINDLRNRKNLKGLYILNGSVLKILKTIKIGMSEILENRWYDYTSIFSDPYYEIIYIFNDKYTREDILYIEKYILLSTEFMKQNKGLQTEYREYNNVNEIIDCDIFIQDVLNMFGIEYEVIKNPIFNRPERRSTEMDLLDEELNNLGICPFERNRNMIQNEYIQETIQELNLNKKVLIKAPTGFGKSQMIFKILKKRYGNINVIFTPRKNLNKQMISEKYKKLLGPNFIFYDFSSSSYVEDEKLLNNIIEYKKPILIVLCYQSARTFYEYLIENSLMNEIYIENVIFDEAHFISSWYRKNKIKFDENISDESSSDEDELSEEELENYRKFEYKKFWLLNDSMIENRIFATATPLESMIQNTHIYGKCIEKIKVHELMNMKILCDIVTIVQQLDEGYPYLIPMIEQCMNQFNKKKGIIYVNNQNNAKTLFNLFKNHIQGIKVFICISEKNYDNLIEFDTYMEKSVIITCQKISMGYDNDYIDFICFADPKYSDIDIRQTIGRGLRWNHQTYENKILHILLPVYKDSFVEDTSKFKLIKKYLDFIIGECDKDIIRDSDGNIILTSNNSGSGNERDFIGNIIPIEILKEYCTNEYQKFSKFKIFLRLNNVNDKDTYNQLKNTNDWIPELEEVRRKYPKFYFQDILIDKTKFYLTKEESIHRYSELDKFLKNNKRRYKEMNNLQKLTSIREIDEKIPDIDFDIYYQ
jgi:superfamily II DNA or RNA helicase